MSLHVYPRRAVYKDYAWAVAGLVLAGIPIVIVAPGSMFMWVLVIALLLFTAYAYTAFRRQFTWFQTDSHGVKGRALSDASFLWREITEVKLAYYATRRDKSNGWMTLTIRTHKRRFTMESSISDFHEIAEGAFKAAITNRLELDATTVENFEAIGHKREAAA